MTTPPRLAPILAQFEFARGRLLDRLVGLTDDEYLWEPVPGCWSIRPRAQVAANRSYGSGAWQLERAYPEPDPAPFTTLAWRLCHLASGTRLRADYTIGTKSLTYDTYEIPHTADAAIAALTAALDAWHGPSPAPPTPTSTGSATAFPWGLDPTLPSSTSPGGSIRNSSTTAAKSPCCATCTAPGRADPRPAHRTEAIDEHRHRVLARHHRRANGRGARFLRRWPRLGQLHGRMGQRTRHPSRHRRSRCRALAHHHDRRLGR
ncbi:MAG: DinB family protein [Thermomicrobiales bacterium]